MMNWVKKYYQKQQFFPGVVGIFINPFYFARSGLSNAMADFALELSGRVLDVGCGTKPYRSLFDVEDYVGLDIDNESTRKRGIADYLYDGGKFPFEDASYDSILCNQVLEHVFNPDEFLGEIRRVLKPGGKLLLTVPFVWDEHEQPHDYTRYTSFGIRAMLERHGFELIEFRKTVDDIRIVFQLLNAYLYKKLQTGSEIANLISTVIFIAPINIMGEIISWVTPRNTDLYLDNVVLAKKRPECVTCLGQ